MFNRVTDIKSFIESIEKNQMVNISKVDKDLIEIDDEDIEFTIQSNLCRL